MYKVLVSESISFLESDVKEALREGWTLAGGVCVYPNERTTTAAPSGQYYVKLSYAQALIKEKNV